MLLPEADAVPGVEQLGLGGRNLDVVPRPPLVHPAVGREAVEIPDELRLDDRVAGVSDPDVRPAPVRLVVGRAEEVAGEAAVEERGGAARRVAAPRRLDLQARGGGILEPGRERRLGRAVAAVALRQELGSRAEVLVGEGPKLRPGHAVSIRLQRERSCGSSEGT